MIRNIKTKFLFTILWASLGINHGQAQERSLQPCPETPNCVSSKMDTSDKHYIAPIDRGTMPAEEAVKKIEAILIKKKRVEKIISESNYLKFEFISSFFRFVDDVEFYLPTSEPVIHVRSASRSGRYDFEVNRKRVEAIRKEFAQD